MLTNEKIKAKIQDAFRPLRCVAEIWDYDYKLRFKVFNEQGEGVIEVPEVVLQTIREGPKHAHRECSGSASAKRIFSDSAEKRVTVADKHPIPTTALHSDAPGRRAGELG